MKNNNYKPFPILAPVPSPAWNNREKHRQFIRGLFEITVDWFQFLCFLYVAVESIRMAAEGDHEKSINWALVAIIIKPYGNRVENPLENVERTK